MSGRYWVVSNPSVKNALGQSVGYKLMPGENILPFAHPSASVIKRAGFMTKHLWVTPYDQDEMAATGPYPNQISPVAYCGFSLKPVGFFATNPGLDVPTSAHYNGACYG